AIFKADKKSISSDEISALVDIVVDKYRDVYINIAEKSEQIKQTIEQEGKKFAKTLTNGVKEFNKILEAGHVNGAQAMTLFTTYGFPLELTLELALERGVSVDVEGFDKEMKKHQELSRKGAEQKFKGGLADTSE
ncbi:MAG: alanine--tRNA ligase, partial [Phycisphaerae bacterium]|nr:alanine--tRNA ligase [candidate division KSB1 bacterium]NIV00712.1 alanine--tRNA ligase [Phycisphaerae bacterium]NIS24146.1 alanine--tRNA ligase [candidate division KSB1 bacterium]NIT71060.1 alanine--tRNA ligase [candidate division KSB1 bacterium]NIU24765.1 alanine--tRNA ligase [candidate division KSB1 bacterium]